MSTLWSRKRYIACLVIGLISWILYFIHFIMAIVYRKAYDDLENNYEAAVDGDSDHYGFWRSYSLMLISCAVMMSYYFVTYIVNKFLMDYTVEFI